MQKLGKQNTRGRAKQDRNLRTQTGEKAKIQTQKPNHQIANEEQENRS